MSSSNDLRSRSAEGHGSVRDHMTFLGSWLRRPMRVASIAPSGRQLARLITDSIDPDGGTVLELGPGTGAFTSALVAKGVPAGDIHAVEMDERMARLLSDRFPGVNVTVANATQLCRDTLPLPGDFASAISGLPVLSMSTQDQARVLAGVFRPLDGAPSRRSSR